MLISRRAIPYCYSLKVRAKFVAPNLTYCKMFEIFMAGYLEGDAKASLLIPRQRCAYVVVTPNVPAISYHIREAL